MNLNQIAKAVVAGTIALGGMAGTALADGHVTAGEYVAGVVATVVAFFGVWAVKNADA